MKLYLTDGVQEISAIEYKPMRNLTCDITPGLKVLIKGKFLYNFTQKIAFRYVIFFYKQ